MEKRTTYLFPYEHLLMGHEKRTSDYKKTLNDKLYISGSETASENPGYMEGAVVSKKYCLNFNKLSI
jgi:monoamine oxidase